MSHNAVPFGRFGGLDLGVPNGNGKAQKPRFAKGIGFGLAPDIEFIGLEGTASIVRYIGGGSSDNALIGTAVAYSASAYCHAAVRYRARKLAEAPLMIAREKSDGTEDWLPDHPLAVLLDEPSPDFDMGELLARTQIYLDVSGSAIWVKDIDSGGMPGRLTPFSGNEFKIEEAGKRIRGKYIVRINNRDVELPPERVVYFHEVSPYSWTEGLSLVDVVLAWLNLGQAARAATHDVLDHALFPSVIVQADPEWDPEPPEFEKYKAELIKYSRREHKGEPLALLGGGSATRMSLTLKDLIPADILDRVESVVSAVFGVPAVVLQFLVGLSNSPWSQMAEARRMCYEDTIEPLWREYEKRLSRQLLWAPTKPNGQPLESDRSRFVRFDRTKIAALQVDKGAQADIALKIAGFATENEQRALLGLEPKTHPEADMTPSERAKLNPQPVSPNDESDNAANRN